jgi:hypothetical protein
MHILGGSRPFGPAKEYKRMLLFSSIWPAEKGRMFFREMFVNTLLKFSVNPYLKGF